MKAGPRGVCASVNVDAHAQYVYCVVSMLVDVCAHLAVHLRTASYKW